MIQDRRNSLNSKIAAAERNVSEMLLSLPADVSAKLVKCPRDVKTILAAVFHVQFELLAGLTLQKVQTVLQSKYRVELDENVPEDPVALGAYVYAVGNKAFVFAETAYGGNYLRFGLAHEGGHLYLEYLKKYWKNANQKSLFDQAPEAFYAHRDPPSFVDEFMSPSEGRKGQEAVSWLDPDLRAKVDLEKERGAHRLRESIASAFAAELLMPRREILQILKDDMNAPGQIEKNHLADFKGRFEVSEWAMLRRLHELGAIPDDRYVALSGRTTPGPYAR